MIARYLLPGDDLALTADTVTVSAGSPDMEDAEYPASNIISASPSRPAKLTDVSGYWELGFGSAIDVIGAAIIYHNFDAGLDVTIEDDAAFSEAIIIPPHHEDGWPVSPFVLFDTPHSADVWRLVVNGTNSQNLQVGRLILFTALRDLGVDVRWGVVEDEEYGVIEQSTEAGVETIYDLGGKRRSFNGMLGLVGSETNALLTLQRSAKQRVLPWLLIPDLAVNDAWFVRFESTVASRTRVGPTVVGSTQTTFNEHPFRVKELSRGLPWP